MGPRCPECQTYQEFTAAEVDEKPIAPKIFCCIECFAFFTLDIDEMVEAQERVAFYWSLNPNEKETEEDWQKARYEWDFGPPPMED